MAAKYQAYPHYGDSSGGWFRHVPEHWEVARLKYLARFGGGGTPSKDKPEFWQGAIPWVSPKDMKSSRIVETIDKVTEAAVEQSSTSLIDKDALLMVVRSGILQHSIPVAINDVPVTLNQDMKALRFNARMTSRYAINVIAGHQKVLLLEWRKEGATVESIEQEYLQNTLFPVPSASEQEAIANFLDHETAKIDTLIEKQQQLIKLLKEKRQAVISHAVTKGLNPDAPMRDSGVQWLGEVPKHWGVSKVRYAATLESGHTPSRDQPEYWENCYIPWVSLADVWQLRDGRNKYISETKEKISELGVANSAARLLPKGTVILSRTASVGFAGIMADEMATTQDFANWICREKLRPEYLLFCFWSMRSEFDRLMVGSTHKTIYMPDIKEICVALPPIEEQEAIIKYLNEVEPRFQKIECQAEQAIKLLQERRTALISAAVTGKIDVRSWVAPQQQHIENNKEEAA